ncbi:MAG: DUF3857 domain-containing protein [Chitinophagaceae bacterium]|nr:DUF3857 domain-containing protein [Chitinophagaceae bacterium]
MKRVLLFLFYTAMVSNLKAQKGLPAFGKIDKADLEMKDCSFDKGADALTLIDFCDMHYDRGTAGITLFKTVYKRRTRIKILKEKGIAYADVSIPFISHNNDEKILKFDAYTYNLDESGNIRTTPVGKSSIYTKKINRNVSKLVITFPEVKAGSVIEYRYEIERETWSSIKDWYFQGRIPVQYSEYQIKVPLVFQFSEQKSVIGDLEVRDEVFEDMITNGGDTYTLKSIKKNYIMRNLVGIRDEPFMPSARDYLQRLELDLSQLDYGNGDIKDIRTKWSDVVQELNKDEDFGSQLKAEVPATAMLVAQAKQVSDSLARMRLVFDQVRRNLTWDGEETIYSYSGLNKSYETKKGSNADINLLLINLLSQAGIPAKPILFSTRENGLVNTYYPKLDQFNSVMAYVPLGGRYYILDATDRFSSYKIIPAAVVNTKGFLLDNQDGRWLDIVDTKTKFKQMIAIRADIDASGLLKGDATINSSGYARRERCEKWVADKDAFKARYVSAGNPQCRIDEMLISNVEADSMPLEQKMRFSMPLSSSGEYRYFTANLFTGLEKNPFLAETRQSDVDFGYLQDFQIFDNFTLPEGYVTEGLPEDLSLVMPDNSIVFNRYIKAEENLINIRMSLEFKSPFYTSAGYAEFREFYKKLFSILNEQIVIKKK